MSTDAEGIVAGIRRAAKRAAEHALVRGGAAAIGSRLHRERPVILAYHNVIPDGRDPVGERSLHVRRSDFARQLDRLAAIRHVVPLDALWEPGDRGRAAVTFDDAYLGALTHGVDELVERGLPATVFACPGLLGGTAFWWDALAGASGGVLPGGLRRTALWELSGRQEAVLAWAEERGLPVASPADVARCGDEEDLLRAASRPGIRLGSHTWSHPNLAALPPDEVDDELARSRSWLEDRVDDAVPWLSYPYGIDDEGPRRAVRAHYEAALRVSGGLGPPAAPPMGHARRYCLPRINIPAGVTLENFELRLAGIVGS